MNELNPDILITGYMNGFFPMADEITGEIYWYQPELRAIFPLDKIKFQKSLLQKIKRGEFEFKINNNFEKTIRACAKTHKNTWISEEIIKAYTSLYNLGFAHSVECYRESKLVGGLYGVALGGAFFGESMFNLVSDASKAAFYYLVQVLREKNYQLLDSQFINPFTAQLGAVEVTNEIYQSILYDALQLNCNFNK